MRIAFAVLALISFVVSSPAAQRPARSLAHIESNVVFGMYSGLALLMDVHHPDGPNGSGVVIVPGSGWHSSLGYDARPLAQSIRGPQVEFQQAMLAAGDTVVVINHHAAPRFRHPAAVVDAQRAVRFIRHEAKRFGVSGARIGGFGYSSGAHVIALAGMLDGAGNSDSGDPVERESARLQVVVTDAMPTDLLVPVSARSAPAVAALLGLVVPPGATPASEEVRIYRDASPVRHVSKEDAPLLLIHGDADEEVPIRHAELMVEAATKAGLTAKLLRIPGGTHGDLHKPGGPDYLGEMVTWFNRHLRQAR